MQLKAARSISPVQESGVQKEGEDTWSRRGEKESLVCTQSPALCSEAEQWTRDKRMSLRAWLPASLALLPLPGWLRLPPQKQSSR